MRSKGVPCSASAQMRRAISTHSKLSPGAEKSSVGSGGPEGGGSEEKSQVRTRSSVAVGGVVSMFSAVTPRIRSSDWMASSPVVAVAKTLGDFRANVARSRS